MTDPSLTITPLPMSPTEAMDKAKEATLRYNRNFGTLKQKQITLDHKRARLATNLKQAKLLQEDITSLEIEIPVYEKHIAQLEIWCSTHMDMPDQISQAEELAYKIKRLQKQLEIAQQELKRKEDGLPDIVAG